MAEEVTGGESGDGTASEPTSTGSSAPAVPEGYVSKVELDAAEARRRSFQAEADRLKAENLELQRRVASGGSGASGNDGGGGNGVAGGITLAEMTAELDRRQALAEAKGVVASDYPLARPEVLKGNYHTTEEFIAAAARSHAEETQTRERYAKEAEERVRAELLKADPGLKDRLTPQAPPSGGEGGPAKLTKEAWLAMSLQERMQVPDDVLQAALAS